MRKAITVLGLLFATSAFAQNNTFGVFLSNPGGGYTQSSGSYLNGGLGVELQHQFAPRWTGALLVAREAYDYRALATGGNVVSFTSHVWPVDVLARYDVVRSGHFHAYAGGGVRFVPSQHGPIAFGDRTTPELNVGLTYQFSRSFGIFADVKQGLRGETGPRYDPLTKTAFGLRFGF